MPSYPFGCNTCDKPFIIHLSYQDYGESNVSCPHCDSQDVERRLARVRYARSEESRLNALADPASLAGIEDDPKAMGKMMRQMSTEMGEDMGSEFNEVVSRLEKGDSPGVIEKDMPDLGSASDDD